MCGTGTLTDTWSPGCTERHRSRSISIWSVVNMLQNAMILFFFIIIIYCVQLLALTILLVSFIISPCLGYLSASKMYVVFMSLKQYLLCVAYLVLLFSFYFRKQEVINCNNARVFSKFFIGLKPLKTKTVKKLNLCNLWIAVVLHWLCECLGSFKNWWCWVMFCWVWENAWM